MAGFCLLKMSDKDLIPREWCYCQNPVVYDVYCDLCGSGDITWSEYEGRIWCYECSKDTKGTLGIFGSPIPMGLCAELGISFDRIRLSDGKILKQEKL